MIGREFFIMQRLPGIASGDTIATLAFTEPSGKWDAAGITLAAMSAGLGLLLGESYPDFARIFCFPYALLALAVAVLSRALHAGGRPIGGEE